MFSWPHSRAKRVAAITTIMLGVFCIFLLCVVIRNNQAAYLPAESLSKDLSDINEDTPLLGEDYVLKTVHMVFRHGQRTPADTYPNDIYVNETFYPYGWGQLTNYGKLTLYNIGKWARRRYGTLLGETYQPSVMHAQSTGVTRTQMSLSLVLASLWEPHNTPLEWNNHLNWQPLPFTYEKLEEDTLLLVRVPCPRYHEELERVLNSNEIKDVIERNAQMMRELTNITGLEIKTPDDVQSLYSTLKAEQEFGLKLPEWTVKYYPQRMQEITDFSYVVGVFNDELKLIKGGPFLKKTLNEWKGAARGDASMKKIYIYAGHDATVVNLLSAFNVWESQFPDYAIMGVFELYENVKTGEHSVQILLKKANHPPEVLTIPNCDNPCPLNKLEQLLSNHLPQDMKQSCVPKDDNFTEPPPRGP